VRADDSAHRKELHKSKPKFVLGFLHQFHGLFTIGCIAKINGISLVAAILDHALIQHFHALHISSRFPHGFQLCIFQNDDWFDFEHRTNSCQACRNSAAFSQVFQRIDNTANHDLIAGLFHSLGNFSC